MSNMNAVCDDKVEEVEMGNCPAKTKFALAIPAKSKKDVRLAF